MIATFFRWRLVKGADAEFRHRWNAATLHFLDAGSHGSSLWRDPEGNPCAFALWPDRATRDAAFAAATGLAPLRGLIAETLDHRDLDLIDNHWRLPSPNSPAKTGG